MRILCLLLLLSSSALAAAEWKTFTSAAGRFTIEGPGRPVLTVKTEQTPLGPVDRTNAVWREPDVTWNATFSDLPALSTALGPRPIFAQVRDGFKRRTGATVLLSEDVRVQGHPGHSLEFVLPAKDGNGPRAGRAQALLVGSRLYVLTATWTSENLPPDRGAAFFGTFRLEE